MPKASLGFSECVRVELYSEFLATYFQKRPMKRTLFLPPESTVHHTAHGHKRGLLFTGIEFHIIELDNQTIKLNVENNFVG